MMLWWSLYRLRSGNVDARLKAIDELAAAKSSRTVAPLQRVAQDDGDEGVRFAALAGLAVLGSDRPYAIKTAARKALAEIGADAVPPLLAILASGTETAREGAAQALAAVGRPALEPLIGLLKNPTAPTHAAKAVRSIGGPKANDALASWRQLQERVHGCLPRRWAYWSDSDQCHVFTGHGEELFIGVFRPLVGSVAETRKYLVGLLDLEGSVERERRRMVESDADTFLEAFFPSTREIAAYSLALTMALEHSGLYLREGTGRALIIGVNFAHRHQLDTLPSNRADLEKSLAAVSRIASSDLWTPRRAFLRQYGLAYQLADAWLTKRCEGPSSEEAARWAAIKHFHRAFRSAVDSHDNLIEWAHRARYGWGGVAKFKQFFWNYRSSLATAGLMRALGRLS